MVGLPRKIGVVVLLVVVVATVLFIVGHGLQGTENSWGESNVIAALFEPVLRRLYGFVAWVSNRMGHAWGLSYGVFVRKCAHVIEYAVLGAECAAVTVVLVGKVISPHLWADLFIPLAVSVTDEYVQSFVGRTSVLSDVVLDFSAALAGIAIVLIVASLVARGRKKAALHKP